MPDVGAQRSSLRGGLGPLARACLGAAVGFLIVNAAVGLTLFWIPGHRIDPVLGDVSQKGLFVRGTEGYCLTHINSLGLRAPEPAVAAKYPERILCVGDSFTLAYQVLDSQTYVLRMQTLLRSRGHDVEGVNAGILGASVADALFLGPELRRRYEPTRTVLQMGDHDFGPQATEPRANACWLEPSGRGWVARRAAPATGVSRTRDLIARYTPAAYWLSQRARSWGDGPPVDKELREEQAANASGADQRLVEWCLTSLKAEYGDDFVLLYSPAVDYAGDWRQPTVTERQVHEACDRLGVTFVDVRSVFWNDYSSTRQPLNGSPNTLPGTGHWNARGHALIAAELATVVD